MSLGNDEKTKKLVTRILRVEMAKHELSYISLAGRLQENGIAIKENDLRIRICRGGLNAGLFIRCLQAMGVKNLQLDESYFEEKGSV